MIKLIDLEVYKVALEIGDQTLDNLMTNDFLTNDLKTTQ